MIELTERQKNGAVIYCPMENVTGFEYLYPDGYELCQYDGDLSDDELLPFVIKNLAYKGNPPVLVSPDEFRAELNKRWAFRREFYAKDGRFQS